MRLIDADEETKWANENLPDAHAGVITCFLRDCATIDPVHAAGGCYCRECKGYGVIDLGQCTTMGARSPDDFCSYGERKEEEK